jgi:hypothetical protein
MEKRFLCRRVRIIGKQHVSLETWDRKLRTKYGSFDLLLNLGNSNDLELFSEYWNKEWVNRGRRASRGRIGQIARHSNIQVESE